MSSVRVAVAALVVVTATQPASATAACASAALTVSEMVPWIAVERAGPQSRVLARLATSAVDAPVVTTALGPDGADVWRYAAGQSELVAARAAGGRLVTLVATGTGACARAVSTTRRISDGRTIAVADAGRVLRPGESVGNVVSVAAGDIAADPGDEVLVEVRARGTGASHAVYTADAYRDVTPGAPRRGWVGVIGQNRVVKSFDGVPALGPGPLSGVYRAGGSARAVVVLNEPGDGAAARVSVTSWSRGRTHWVSHADVLPDAGTVVGLSSGPGIVTGALLREAGLPPLTYRAMRFTALDGRTGAVRWEREWLAAGSAVHFAELDGDLLVQDQRLGVVSRLRAADGQPVWEVRYADEQMYGVLPPTTDPTGDGVPDVVVRDAAPTPITISGRDGGVLPRPVLLAASAVFPVRDLDGDGADDAVVIVGASAAVGVPVTAAAEVVAVAGRTGLPMWRAAVPPTPYSTVVAAGPLRPGRSADVVVYQLYRSVRAFEGATGSPLWVRDVPGP